MTNLKETAKRIFLETLRTIEPGPVINQALQVNGEALSVGGEQIALGAFDEVVVIGMGKASLKMGAAAEGLLGNRIRRGILVSDRRSAIRVRSEVIVAGHPLPNANSLRAGERIVELVQSCGDNVLIIFLISGGGSSLVELPKSPSISLEDLREMNRILIGCGASIREINIIRKTVSQIKGGRLGCLARTSKCVGLYLSDVNPGDVRSIASNPLLPEQITPDDLADVVNKFKLIEELPASVVNVVRESTRFDCASEWTQERKLPVTVILLDNSNAVLAAVELARRYGFRVDVDEDLIEGGYEALADRSIEHLMNLRNLFPNERVCVISGGEVSCSVHGNGIGGRNQEFVLYSASRLAGSGIRAAVLSCGTDGIDGKSSAAGAVADSEMVTVAARRGEDPSVFIRNNDSYSFFKKFGGLVVTGPTGNNVRDIRVLMAQ